MNAKDWFSFGSLIKVDNKKLFVYDSDPHAATCKSALVILHGYPTCSYDYYKVLPYLEKHFRVIIHDHLGFGYSDKPHDYSYSLIDQADYALLLWQKLGIRKAHILAHDYGTSIATEIIARHNKFRLNSFMIESVTLCNGSMHIELAKLRLIQKLLLNKITGCIIAKLSNKRTLSKNLKNIYFNPSKISNDEISSLWEMMTHNNGRSILHKTTQYIKERHLFWHRWIGALKSTDLAINIIWAKNDPIAVIAMAHVIFEETNHSQLVVLDNLGHFPMLEAPKKWAEAVIHCLDKI